MLGKIIGAIAGAKAANHVRGMNEGGGAWSASARRRWRGGSARSG